MEGIEGGILFIINLVANETLAVENMVNGEVQILQLIWFTIGGKGGSDNKPALCEITLYDPISSSYATMDFYLLCSDGNKTVSQVGSNYLLLPHQLEVYIMS